MKSSVTYTPIEKVLADFKAGKMVLILDHVDRENEGDLAIATECVTEEAISFMATYGRGLICVSIDQSVAQRLNLPLQVLNNNSPFNTPFTVSVDHRSVAHEGILYSSRAKSMTALIEDSATENDFISPGHVFPLIANPAGVLGRQGQTEGSYDLARLAGLKPSGIICEILNTDGTMMRGPDLEIFAARHGLSITSVSEIIQYRVREEVFIREVAVNACDTDFGAYTVHVFQDDVSSKEHMALVYGEISQIPAPLVRIHSECLTGDVFGSLRCDCGEQLSHSAEIIKKEGAGIILYLRQEGRGIGLGNKLKAYALQDKGLDTVEANLELGFAADERDFAVAAHMLNALSVSKVRILTNNPEKLETLREFGIEIVERLELIVEPTKYSQDYLDTKRTKLGHLF